MVLINRTDRKYWSQAEGDQYWQDAEISDSFEKLLASWQYSPSNYQKEILEWLINSTGNGCCNAVAGSGKSSTLRMAGEVLEKVLKINPSNIRIIVFGKANSQDLINKFGVRWKQSISTLHSAGFQILQSEVGKFQRQDKIDNLKYRKICQDLRILPKRDQSIEDCDRNILKFVEKGESFIKIIDLLRLTLSPITLESVRALSQHHNIEGIKNYQGVAESAQLVLAEGVKRAKSKQIDYTDMIWLPVFWELGNRQWFRPFNYVLVDECQDLNKAQLELSLMLAGKSGRLLFVGDPRQAILGFAGADCDSYNNILARVNAKELPLSICYRCPQSHIKLVKHNFPEIPIEAWDKAEEGEIKRITSNEISETLKLGDMVLSRKTAPLVSLCIQLLGKGIKATVRGRDIADQLIGDIESIAQLPNFSYPNFMTYLQQWQLIKSQSYRGRDNEDELLELLADKIEAIKAIFDAHPECLNVDHLGEEIKKLFSDDDSPITLSTIHRSKGLENDRVFIIKPDDLPLVWRNQLDWQLEQEYNLLYVALTRAKKELIVVGNASWLPSEEKAIDHEATSQPSDILVLPDKDQHSSELEPDVKAEVEDNPQLAGLEEALTHCAGDWFGTAQVLRLIKEELTIDFAQYCKDKFGWSKRHCDRLIAASVVVDNLINAGLIKSEIPTESVIRPIANLTIDQQLKVWEQVKEYDRITAQLVEQLKAEFLAKTINESDLIKRLIDKFGVSYLMQMLEDNPEDETEETNKSYCKGCGAEIIWVKTKTGNLTPNNLDGTTHWATCTHAKEFKR